MKMHRLADHTATPLVSADFGVTAADDHNDSSSSGILARRAIGRIPSGGRRHTGWMLDIDGIVCSERA